MISLLGGACACALAGSLYRPAMASPTRLSDEVLRTAAAIAAFIALAISGLPALCSE